jgi:hypothetical protein
MVANGTTAAANAVTHGAATVIGATAYGAAQAGQTLKHGVQAIEDGASRAYQGVRDWVSGGKSAASHPPLPHPPLQLNQPGHDNYAMFQQATTGVQGLNPARGRASDVQSAQLSGSLVVAGRKAGLDRIDSVWLSDDASRVFAVQGKPGSPEMKLASVSTVEAVNTPIAQSTQALEQLKQQTQAQAQQPQVQQPQVQQAAPPPQVQHGSPAMAM